MYPWAWVFANASVKGRASASEGVSGILCNACSVRKPVPVSPFGRQESRAAADVNHARAVVAHAKTVQREERQRLLERLELKQSRAEKLRNDLLVQKVCSGVVVGLSRLRATHAAVTPLV